MNRMRFWWAAILLIGSGSAVAQGYPTKPIRLVVPFAVGSGTDIMARVVADELQKNLNGNIIVDNKPGASGQIAAEQVAKSAPDGYTLFMATNTALSANPHLFKKLAYDPIKDFTAVARTNYFVFLLVVSADSPMKTAADVIARAKANPGKMTYAFGNSTGQVAGAHFARAGKIDVLAVPYKSTPPALTDLVSNQVDFMFVDWASSKSYIDGGKLKAIAVQSDERSALLPDLPPAGDTTPGFSFVIWGGIVAPAGTPAEIVAKLNAGTVKALASPAVKQRMAGLGLEPAPSGVSDFQRFLVDQVKAWGDSIKEAGIQPD